jgi:hypothetical protein
MMKHKILLLLLLVLQSPLPGAASSSLNAGADKANDTTNTHHPVFGLNQQLKQLTDLLTTAERNGHSNKLSAASLQNSLKQLEQQWQLLFQQQGSGALNKVYNQFQVEIQLLQQQLSGGNTSNLTTYAKTLEQLRLRLLVLQSSTE